VKTISYHMQIDTLWPFRTICRSIHYDHFVYAKSYADSTFSLILHHIQINVMPKYNNMLHVGTVKSMYFKRKKTQKQTNKKKIYILLILLNVQWFQHYYYIYSLFIILFNKDNYFVTTCRTFEVIKFFSAFNLLFA